MSTSTLIDIDPEVAEAVQGGRAVVALESTIITHGMPYPQNLATAREVEAVVREGGAVPATIAVMDGRVRVGLDASSLDLLASGHDAVKASSRDLACVLVSGGTAGTTVAATMAIAARAGIALFATGGIGGVHRGAQTSFDVSADLPALGTIPVTVVCAGAKSILDIPKTLEYLETQGVPILGYQTHAFPAFFTRDSGEAIEHRCETPAALASVIATHRALGLPGGILIVNPIPEADSLPGAMIDAEIARACRDAEQAGITGKALTPYLLARINALTDGGSLVANIALVKNNAALAAAVAVALVGLDG